MSEGLEGGKSDSEVRETLLRRNRNVFDDTHTYTIYIYIYMSLRKKI